MGPVSFRRFLARSQLARCSLGGASLPIAGGREQAPVVPTVAVDDLMRRCQFSASAVVAAPLEPEIVGRMEMLAGNRVAWLD